MTTPMPPADAAMGGRGPALTAVGWTGEMVVAGMAGVTWVGADLAPVGARSTVLGLVGAGLAITGWLGWNATTGRWRSSVALAVALTGVFLLAGHRGRAADDAHRPLPPGPLPSPVEVIGDPEPLGPAGWRVEIRLPGGERVEAVAYGGAGAAVSRLGLGQAVEVDGRLGAVGDRAWLRTRHVVARASISSATVVAEPGWLRSAVEAVRRRVAAGGDVLADRPRSLYHGLVLGDDRFQPPGQTLRFRLSGLSHLLAVSGQNVAFVLTALAPITDRLGRRWRLVGLLVILVVFALITRLEPSVLRAVSTAGLSAWATMTGRTRSGIGVLAAAVTVLILVDPFLVDSVGFQLSVAASAGILLLSPALIRRLPGPGWLVAPLATTLGAQVAVAPLLSHYFGPVSVVAIPANLAAGWAAAGTMIWGMSIGPVAGLLPEPLAWLVQRPVVLLLWWLEAVAAVGAGAPDPRPGLGAVALLGGSVVLARSLATHSGGWRWPTGLVSTLVAGLVGATLVTSVPRAPTQPAVCGSDITWYPRAPVPDAPSVVVIGSRSSPDSVETCRRSGVRTVDLVVLEVGTRRTARTVSALREVMAVGVVLAPGQHMVIGARRQLDPTIVAVAGGRLHLEPESSGRRLVAALRP